MMISWSIRGVPRMTQTNTSVSMLTGRQAASLGKRAPRRQKGLNRPVTRKGRHLFMEPKATTSPRGRENSNVKKNSFPA